MSDMNLRTTTMLQPLPPFTALLLSALPPAHAADPEVTRLPADADRLRRRRAARSAIRW